jgi:AbrB family looped-hinge helix DNA binding protein
MSTTVTSKGQVTIPKQMRDYLGLQPGSEVDFSYTADGQVVAGKADRIYRRRGGEKPGVLSDFFIGAHAAVLGVPLLTRDARRFRRYFPSVLLLTP